MPQSPLHPRRQRHDRHHHQGGAFLVEVMVAILVFSVGILGVIGLQAGTVSASTEARLRNEASLLASRLIGQMWVSDRTPNALQSSFGGNGQFEMSGPAYMAWAWGPGASPAAPASGSVMQTLPGAQAYPPKVELQTVASGPAVSSTLVTITLYWQLNAASPVHNLMTSVQIGG